MYPTTGTTPKMIDCNFASALLPEFWSILSAGILFLVGPTTNDSKQLRNSGSTCQVRYAVFSNDHVQLTVSLEPHDPKLQRKIKQWLALTKEILTDSDQQSMECAEQFILDYALEESQRLLEGVTDMVLTDNVLAELSDAMSPFLQVFRLLQYQRCPYTFEMLPAADEDEWNRFDPTEMEGMFGEKTGLIKASLFPQLCRLEMGGQDDVSDSEDCSLMAC
jgi:hypothetical protein